MANSAAPPTKLLPRRPALPADSIPANDVGAERGVLGSMLHDHRAARIAIDLLSEDDFWNGQHKTLFGLFSELFPEQADLDLIFVESEIKKRGLTQRVGGLDAIGRLLEETPSPVNIERYCRIVREVAEKRRVQIALTHAGSELEMGVQLVEVIARLQDDLGRVQAQPSEDPLPIRSMRKLLDNPPPAPPELIKGVAYQGSKITLASNSKGRKTWLQLNLSVCVATGTPWLGHQVTQGRVLYVNLELLEYSLHRRVEALERFTGTRIPEGAFDYLQLRGRRMTVEHLADLLTRQIAGQGYVLLILDPLYKLLGYRSENDNSEMANLMEHLEGMAFGSGAALLAATHFSKGNAGNKNALDRASGAGVVARDGDAILVLTEHEEPDAVTLECILRDFPPVAPKALRWSYPAFVPADDLVPCKHAQGGRKKSWNEADVLGAIGGLMLHKEAVQSIRKATGLSERQAKTILSDLTKAGKVLNDCGAYRVI